MTACSNRYSGGEDYRFPALKCRTESFRKFRYSPRGRRLELEGIFIYESSSPPRKPAVYTGYLDLREEYRLLGLRPPEKKQTEIKCYIPSDLASKEKLILKPNIRVSGQVAIDMDKTSTKHVVVDELEFIPVRYRAVGAPVFEDFEDMFTCIYSRESRIYEHGPILLLASLIGSEKRSLYFPDENVGCGINIGASAEDVPGKVSSGAINIPLLTNFIKRVNVGSLNKLTNQFHWNRFLSVKNPEMLSRKIKSSNEIDWNLISEIGKINQLRRSEFIASDVNLVFDPNIFPPKINKEDAKNMKQTLLFAKSTPQVMYSNDMNALMEVKTDKLVRNLAKRVDYAPFLFRYRFEPLCDAFLKGSHLMDYLTGGDVVIKRKDIHEFFKRAGDAVLDFATYAEQYIDDNTFNSILDGVRDRRAQDLFKELIVKDGMSNDQMMLYLMDRYSLREEKAESIVSGLVHAEPVLVTRKGNLYKPVG
ncbi:MAG: hypothetical protein U9Q22_06960 [Candidatus Altiarchaeota archaeon]|nr:hypothetical protein [Candidatus Altiarchaeota archaeon]